MKDIIIKTDDDGEIISIEVFDSEGIVFEVEEDIEGLREAVKEIVDY